MTATMVASGTKPPPNSIALLTTPRSSKTDTALVQSQSSFASLPSNVIINELFPVLEVDDIVVLGWVCHALHKVANDNRYWRAQVLAHFPHCPEVLLSDSPQDGYYRRLYLGLKFPRCYTWGHHDKRNERPRHAHTIRGSSGDVLGVCRPLDITGRFVQRVPLVEIQSRGSDYITRDARGIVRVWGEGLSAKPMRFLAAPAVAIAVGEGTFLALDQVGQVWQMTTSDPDAKLVPLRTSAPILQISAGANLAAALTSEGDVYMWSMDPDSSEHTPIKLEPISVTKNRLSRRADPNPKEIPDPGPVVKIAIGDRLFALTSNGELWSCYRPSSPLPWTYIERHSSPLNTNVVAGDDYFAVLSKSSNWPTVILTQWLNPQIPQWVDPRPDVTIAQIAIGYSHIVTLDTDGRVYSWGDNECGELGRGQFALAKSVPGGQVHFPLSFDGRQPFVLSIAPTGAIVLGDGRLPSFYGRRYSDRDVAPSKGFRQRIRERLRSRGENDV